MTVTVSKHTQATVLPEGATVCGFCAEFEDAAKLSAERVMEIQRLRDEIKALHDGSVYRGLAGALEEKSRALGRRESELSQVVRMRLESLATCPLCAWRSSKLKRYVYHSDERAIRRSVVAHLRSKHRSVG